MKGCLKLTQDELMHLKTLLDKAIGFLIGIGFLLLLDNVTPHEHMDEQRNPKPFGMASYLAL